MEGKAVESSGRGDVTAHFVVKFPSGYEGDYRRRRRRGEGGPAIKRTSGSFRDTSRVPS